MLLNSKGYCIAPGQDSSSRGFLISLEGDSHSQPVLLIFLAFTNFQVAYVNIPGLSGQCNIALVMAMSLEPIWRLLTRWEENSDWGSLFILRLPNMEMSLDWLAKCFSLSCKLLIESSKYVNVFGLISQCNKPTPLQPSAPPSHCQLSAKIYYHFSHF